MNGLFQDLRYALRQLRHRPGFIVVAVISLAVGIGANAAVFSTVSALLLHPQAFSDIERLVLLREGRPSQGDDEKTFTPADFSDLANRTHSFNSLAAFRYVNFNLSEPDRAMGAEGAMVSPNFFSMLGVSSAIGRTFNADESEPGREQEVVLSHRYWAANFGADRSLVGKELSINGRRYTVVGIMPEGFNYPVGVDMWTPLALSPEAWADRTRPILHLLAKLKPGVSMAHATAEMKGFAAELATQFPQTNSTREITLLRVREEQYPYTAPMFLPLQAAAVFVLLLICANLGNVMFARLLGRQREIAIRSALGANWVNLAKAFLAENFLISTVAGALAIAVSFWSVNLIRIAMPIGMTKWIAGWDRIRVDTSTLVFAISLTVLLGLLFGAASAVHAARSAPSSALKEGSAGSRTTRRKERMSSGLVVAQFAVAMVLLVGAGLMARGFLHLTTVYQNLQPSHVATMQVSLPQRSYSDNDPRIVSFYDQMLRNIAALPGIESVGIADNIPASNVDNSTAQFTTEGQQPLKQSETPAADIESISANFLSSLRIPLIEGRGVSDADSREHLRVAVISQKMAERFWHGQSPIGRRFKLSTEVDAPWITIVGVVDDVKQNWWDPQPRPVIYLPYQQAPRRTMNVVIRTFPSTTSVAGAARDVIRKIDPEVAPMDVQTMSGVIADALSPVRIIGILMDVFGALALALSALGIYGVLSQGVAQRVREFGIRMALGASRADVLRAVVKQALRLAAIGLAVALPISVLLTRVMTSLLFGLISLSVPIVAGFAVVLVLSAIAAAYIPARRAARVDPMVALRYE